MARTIYKYDLEVTDEQVLELPANAEILTVQMQHDAPKLWAIVDVPQRSATVQNRRIAIYGTGHAMNQSASHRYIATFQMRDGSLVFHVFELS